MYMLGIDINIVQGKEWMKMDSVNEWQQQQKGQIEQALIGEIAQHHRYTV